MGHQILRAYQEINTHLTSIRVEQADLRNGGDQVISLTLRNCTSIRQITLTLNNINAEELELLVEAIREHTTLENLDLIGNSIGNGGCEVLGLNWRIMVLVLKAQSSLQIAYKTTPS